jgi:hypothetical protein
MMPGWFGRIWAGVAGGFVGGVVFGILMQVTGAIPVVASLIDQESVAVGWALHMGIAVFVGATYAIIFGFFSEGVPLSVVLGAFYGTIWWVLGGLTLMPLRLGLGLFVFDASAWQSLAGHLAYGLTMGLVYAMVCLLLSRGPARAAADQPSDLWSSSATFTPPPTSLPPASFPPASPPAFLPPASPPAFLPPLASPPSTPARSGLTPLPPQARALRQRGRHQR